MEIGGLTIAAARRMLKAGSLSPVTLLDEVNGAINRVDQEVGGYLSRDYQRARAAAEHADVHLPLGGIPVAIKDAINVEGEPCSCASKILEGYTAPYDATVISKLRTAGAIPFGRTNMDEFAMGSSTENSSIQITRNPHDPERIPGGSSGGSAAVVAAGEALAALGSDTGGSIRQPAALCGCVGLKPSYGRVSRYGLVAFASSLDQIGPLTRTVEDAALVLQAIAGHDPLDSTSLDVPVPDYSAELEAGVKGMKLGVPKEYFVEGMDPDVAERVREAIDVYRDLGAEIVDVSLPHTKYAVADYYIIATAEASANLARFDGVRYGHRTVGAKDLADHYGRTRGEGFGREVKRRIILGTYVLSSGYYDAYYLRAQKVRTLIRRDFEEAFKQVDGLLSPTSPVPAFKIGERMKDPLQMYLADIFTIAVNLAGICGISVPCGTVQAEESNLPVGLQIMAPAFEESRLLRIARAFEATRLL
ncbi:MAG: Asp-tRNA(Asn)/Glu-tRNA(Gln) amidotransferase subunit GatA [Chthoniobacterales bacterium]|nr:Asp-tRNA(Asn)/Glu-tRNA(Gln) amidotransferase subunit GatA [Chthoniobacterales bacterium]